MTEPTGFAHGGDVPRSYLGARGRSADVEGRSHLIFQPSNGDMTLTIPPPEKSGRFTVITIRPFCSFAVPLARCLRSLT